MATKKENHQVTKRNVRRAEKRQVTEDAPTRDATMGKACRRGWGAGKAK